MTAGHYQNQSQIATPEAVSVHALVINMGFGSLLVPSVMVAEVLHISAIHEADSPRPWVLGGINWRGLSVPVISFEQIVSNLHMGRDDYARAVVFHPLPGYRQDDYFGILTARDPRSIVVGEDLKACALPNSVSGRYIASAVEIRGQVAMIPDIDALATAIY